MNTSVRAAESRLVLMSSVDRLKDFFCTLTTTTQVTTAAKKKRPMKGSQPVRIASTRVKSFSRNAGLEAFFFMLASRSRSESVKFSWSFVHGIEDISSSTF
jgi:hypothetical protein